MYRYSASPYNFYLFHGTPDRKLDTLFTCQVLYEDTVSIMKGPVEKGDKCFNSQEG